MDQQLDQWPLTCKGCPNLFICALVMFLNRVFRREWFNWFLWILASLIKNDRTLRKCFLFSYRYKNVWDIGICLKPHFYKKCVNNFKTLGQSFLELRQISLRALQFYICKFEINCYRRTHCTNSWSNLTSKCNANTLILWKLLTHK